MEKLTPYLVIKYPSVYFEDAEQKKVNTINTDLTSAVERFVAQSIIGEVDIDKEWDGYIKGLEKIGLKELIDIYQKKYDEYLKK